MSLAPALAQVDVTAGIARCRVEIASIEKQIRAGHPDLHGLCLALSDWSAELKLLQQQEKTRGPS